MFKKGKYITEDELNSILDERKTLWLDYYDIEDPADLFAKRTTKQLSGSRIHSAIRQTERHLEYITELEQKIAMLEKFLEIEFVPAKSQPKKAYYKKREEPNDSK